MAVVPHITALGCHLLEGSAGLGDDLQGIVPAGGQEGGDVFLAQRAGQQGAVGAIAVFLCGGNIGIVDVVGDQGSVRPGGSHEHLAAELGDLGVVQLLRNGGVVGGAVGQDLLLQVVHRGDEVGTGSFALDPVQDLGAHGSHIIRPLGVDQGGRVAMVDGFHDGVEGGILGQREVLDGTHGAADAADHGLVAFWCGEDFQNVQGVFQFLLIAGVFQMPAQAVVAGG